MEKVKLVIITVILGYVLFGCLPKTGIEQVDRSLELPQRAGQNLKVAGDKVVETVSEHCEPTGLVPDCGFKNEPVASADQEAYKACVANYENAIKENWAAMTKFQRMSVSMKIIEECTP